MLRDGAGIKVRLYNMGRFELSTIVRQIFCMSERWVCERMYIMRSLRGLLDFPTSCGYPAWSGMCTEAYTPAV